MRGLTAAALGRILLACTSVLSFVASLPPSARARTDPTAPTIGQSRATLDERMARARALLGESADPAPGAEGRRMAQWPNWPNYWSNWPNWRNFR